MGNRIVNYVPVKQGIYEVSTTKRGDIGSVLEFEDGRKYVYSMNGIVEALEPGDFLQGPVLDSNDESIAIATDIAAGDKTVALTSARTYTVNELQDGYMIIDDVASTVIGHMRKIKSHAVVVTSGDVLTLELYDAFTDTAAAGTDTITVMENPYNGVCLSNAAVDGTLIGVAPCHVTLSTTATKYYFWVQVAGPAPAIAGEAIDVGDGLTVDAVAEVVYSCGGADDDFVGWAMRTVATPGDAIMIYLALR